MKGEADIPLRQQRTAIWTKTGCALQFYAFCLPQHTYRQCACESVPCLFLVLMRSGMREQRLTVFDMLNYSRIRGRQNDVDDDDDNDDDDAIVLWPLAFAFPTHHHEPRTAHARPVAHITHHIIIRLAAVSRLYSLCNQKPATLNCCTLYIDATRIWCAVR